QSAVDVSVDIIVSLAKPGVTLRDSDVAAPRARPIAHHEAWESSIQIHPLALVVLSGPRARSRWALGACPCPFFQRPCSHHHAFLPGSAMSSPVMTAPWPTKRSVGMVAVGVSEAITLVPNTSDTVICPSRIALYSPISEARSTPVH